MNTPIDEPENQIEVTSVELKTIETRLNGVKESVQRSRFVFVLMTIIALAILITVWNATLSWDSGLANLPKEVTQDPSGLRIATNQDVLISEWIKNQMISVGLLGIRISVTDLSVIGSFSFIIIMTWYFYSQRRENKAIVSLLRESRDKYQRGHVPSMVFHGIMHSMVFIDFDKSDFPLKGLIKNPEESEEKSTSLVRIVLTILVYLPPLTISLIIFSDLWSLLVPSPMRPGEGSLWNHLGTIETIKVIGFETFAVFSAIYTGSLCYLSRRFSRSTSATLEEYGKLLDTPAS